MFQLRDIAAPELQASKRSAKSFTTPLANSALASMATAMGGLQFSRNGSYAEQVTVRATT